MPTFFILGLCFGSFANVIIWRLPRGESFVWSRSHCPTCTKGIAWFDNVPILSFLILGGRCRICKSRISWRYPLVELLMAIAFAGLFQRYGMSWTLLEYLVFSFGLITVSFIDFDHMILPDVFTLSGIVIGLIGAALNPERVFLSSLWGVLLGGGFLWAVAYAYYLIRGEEGMGGGDIKLLAWIGAVLGWTAVPFVILSSSVVGSLVGLTIAIKTKGGLKATIPFGPYLALGALIFMFGGDQIGHWYLQVILGQ
jgi:leader peptidase (prepilin peptidase)/N-methyltransferase